MTNPSNPNEKTGVQLKRQMTIRTRVTDEFRTRAKKELTQELGLIDTQMQQLDAQYQQSLQELERLAQQGQKVQTQLNQLNQDVQQKRNQLGTLKVQLSAEMGNIDQVENGQLVVTGLLESIVTVNIGDNIYEKMHNAEMIVEDGIVVSMSPN
ncbi:MAG: YlqD family protein [Cyanobacteria bacterium P01_H01_bin.74]